MDTREYDVLMLTPMGKRYGSMSVGRNGSEITGTLSILDHTFPFEGTVDENGICRIAGKFMTLLRTVPYTAVGRISGRSVDLELTGGNGPYSLSGTVREKDGEPQ